MHVFGDQIYGIFTLVINSTVDSQKILYFVIDLDNYSNVDRQNLDSSVFYSYLFFSFFTKIVVLSTYNWIFL